ncbi:MAG: hypothetical protein FWD16_00470 [Clostridia bacterium]|nr:hypothetical protein [Clostridia bacterium]
MDVATLKSLKLKQSPVSNPEVAQPRLQEAWSTLDKQQRAEIVELSGVGRASVDRARRSGSISAKIAVPFAIVCGVSPSYLCGLSDDTAACDNAEIKKFLKPFGYAVKTKRGRKPQIATAEEPAPPLEANLPFTKDSLALLTGSLNNAHRAFIENMTHDDIVTFLLALTKKAGYDEKSKQTLTFLKLLLSVS